MQILLIYIDIVSFYDIINPKKGDDYMKKYLLPNDWNFYKANLHCHSTWSDGKHTPAELKELYKSHGYSVLSITDHEGLFYHSELDDEDFITIAGTELAFYKLKNDPYITAHICFYKKDPTDIYQPGANPGFVHPSFRWTNDPEMKSQLKPKGEPFSMLYTAENINHVFKTMKDEGFISTLNHPTWSMQYYCDYIQYENVDNLEIYNHACFLSGHDEHNGHAYDALLRNKGNKLFITCCDDNHRHITDEVKMDMFGGFTMFKAPSLTYANIMDSFEKGIFYCSEGPDISELYVEDGYIVLKSKTPLQLIRLVSGEQHVQVKHIKNGKAIYDASFEIRPDVGYIRLECVDLTGKRAYTNAYFVEDLI